MLISMHMLQRGCLTHLSVGRSRLQQTRLGGVVCRSVGTSAPQSKDEVKAPFLDRVVNKLNDSITKHPAETLAVLFASDIGSIGA
ncbi:Transmembrane protein, partial [Phytophthora palmivora]